MPKATKFIAKYAGAIVGTRKSPRPYAFAILVKQNVEKARREAYGFPGPWGDKVKADFAYYSKIAAASVGDDKYPDNNYLKGRSFYDEAEITAAKAKIADGYDKFVADLRAAEIDRFEKSLDGATDYPVFVLGWSMSRANAEKTYASAERGGYFVKVGIVPAEVA